MYKNDIKLFTKNEKELETLIQAVRVYSICIYWQQKGLWYGPANLDNR